MPEIGVVIEIREDEFETIALARVEEAIAFAETMDDDDVLVAAGQTVERLVHDASHRIAQQVLAARERLAAEVTDGSD